MTFTPRERLVMKLVTRGMKNPEIAEVIGTTDYMVKNYLKVIFDKIGCWNRVELALWFIAHEEGNLIEGRI